MASYNRGMKLLYAAGGVRTTVAADVMQRAPAFGFASAREARAFGAWVAVSGSRPTSGSARRSWRW